MLHLLQPLLGWRAPGQAQELFKDAVERGGVLEIDAVAATGDLDVAGAGDQRGRVFD